MFSFGENILVLEPELRKDDKDAAVVHSEPSIRQDDPHSVHVLHDAY